MHGIRTPQSPQKSPSSATQRNAPQRSQRRGSPVSLRQVIRSPNDLPLPRAREKRKRGEGSRAGPLGKRCVARPYAFFIRAREMKPFLSRKYM